MKSESNAHLNYFSARLQTDKRRTVTWKALCEFFFQNYVDIDGRVLELGAGHCDFINNIKAEDKLAIDAWKDFPQHANDGVSTYVADVSLTLEYVQGKVDTIFASNLFEHLTKPQVEKILQDLKKIMNEETSNLILLQPNFRLNPGRYFDDYTHVSIWTDVSLSEFLIANGYEVVTILPKFLPLTVKSKIPVSRVLIWFYLKSPIKYKPGQMLMIAKLGK